MVEPLLLSSLVSVSPHFKKIVVHKPYVGSAQLQENTSSADENLSNDGIPEGEPRSRLRGYSRLTLDIAFLLVPQDP